MSKAETQYPYLALGKATGSIYLFVKPCVGKLLQHGRIPAPYPVGSKHWSLNEESFTPLKPGTPRYNEHKHLLTQTREGEKIMKQSQNYSTAVMLINPNIRAISCSYEPKHPAVAQRTAIFKSLNPDIKEGDLVVVPSQSRFNQCVVQVTEVDVDVDFESDCKVEWIIDVVDTKAHEKVIEIEEEALTFIRAAEKAAKKKELREKLLGLKDDAEFENLAIAKLSCDAEEITE